MHSSVRGISRKYRGILVYANKENASSTCTLFRVVALLIHFKKGSRTEKEKGSDDEGMIEIFD